MCPQAEFLKGRILLMPTKHSKNFSENRSQADFKGLLQAIDSFCQSLNSVSKIYLAYSGGMDSTVLLHLLAEKQKQCGFQLEVLHVDHGLHKDSNLWRQHCQLYAQSLGLNFTGFNVHIDERKRKGLESIARQKRYQTMFEYIQDQQASVSCSNETLLLTAHHQRDQAETLLLNLFRGSGLQGLKAMLGWSKLENKRFTNTPVNYLKHKFNQQNQSSIQLVRPLLNVSYKVLSDYAKFHQLNYIDDPSNENTDFKRNYIRHTILPELALQWPGIESRLSKTAGHLLEAQNLLDEMAASTLSNQHNDLFRLDLQDLSSAESKNLIRYWFKLHWPMVQLSSRHYEWIVTSLDSFSASGSKSFSYKLPLGTLKAYQTCLYFLPAELTKFSYEFSSVADFLCFMDDISASYHLSDGDEGFLFKINRKDLNSKVKFSSLESCEVASKKHLKRFFQASSIPVWQRRFWPVLILTDSQTEVVDCQVLGCPEAFNKELHEHEEDCQVVKISYAQTLIFALLAKNETASFID